MLTVCGVDCNGCAKYQNECDGCDAIQGKVFWGPYIGKEVCPIYACVAENKIKHCGECEKLPCEMWQSLKDPDWPDDQHQESIRTRVQLLKTWK